MPAATYSYTGVSRGPARRARRAAPARGRDRSLARVRWDRLGRVAMLGVLAALLGLYLSAGLSLLSTWHESRRTEAAIVALRREYAALSAQHAAMASPLWLETQARRLGMAFPGERQYVIRGLPSN